MFLRCSGNVFVDKKNRQKRDHSQQHFVPVGEPCLFCIFLLHASLHIFDCFVSTDESRKTRDVGAVCQNDSVIRC